MHRKFITPLYIFNMIIQSLFSLVIPIALMLGLSYLLERFLSVDGWIYAVLVPLGAIVGIYSMISFIISTSRAIEAIEAQNLKKQKEENKDSKNEKQ